MVWREEQYDGVTIFEYEEFAITEPSVMIVGLPDTGLVGAISVSHMASQLGAREVGGVELQGLMPPIVLVKKGEPVPAIRIFLKDNVLLVLSEIPVPATYVYRLSRALMDYAIKRRISLLVCVTGVASPYRYREDKPRVFWAASGKDALKRLLGTGIEGFDEGVLVGPYAVILKESSRFRLNTIVIMVESFIDIPDPEAAASALQTFSELLGLKVDVSKLLEEAELIRLRTRELMKHTARVMAQMSKELEKVPPIVYT